MNCEQCQELIHDLVDGSISHSDESTLNTHLKDCLDCESVRHDLAAIVGFCQTRRGEYEAPPNEQALWLRIRNVIEAENPVVTSTPDERRPSFWESIMGRSWQFSLPQLAASVAAIVLLVGLGTTVALRRLETGAVAVQTNFAGQLDASNVNDRVWQAQQVISYWNQRIEQNKARWSQDVRDSFDRSLFAIDQRVTSSLEELKRNPHDEFTEQMVNDAMNEKIAMLKDFSDL
jgi:anti-sigma factor RsiW